MDERLRNLFDRGSEEKKESVRREVYDYIMGGENDTYNDRLHRLNVLRSLYLYDDTEAWFTMVENELNKYLIELKSKIL